MQEIICAKMCCYVVLSPIYYTHPFLLCYNDKKNHINFKNKNKK